jgi:hypothetical protein
MNYERLTIFRPLLSSTITQGWAENRACIDNRGRIYGIARGKKCPGQSFYQSVGLVGHNGYDISARTGEDIYHAATFPGWWRSEVDNMGGIGVDVVSNEPLFFAGTIPAEIKTTAIPHVQNGAVGFLHYVKMRYWHLHKAVGHERKAVTCGTVVGLAGNTGASSATHLHFAPKWCLKDGRGVANDNGFYGAFDPGPYYTHSVTAKYHSDNLTKTAIPLSPIEAKDMYDTLSRLQMIIISLQKLRSKI